MQFPSNVPSGVHARKISIGEARKTIGLPNHSRKFLPPYNPVNLGHSHTSAYSKIALIIVAPASLFHMNHVDKAVNTSIPDESMLCKPNRLQSWGDVLRR